jgi:hypothetical protein
MRPLVVADAGLLGTRDFAERVRVIDTAAPAA